VVYLTLSKTEILRLLETHANQQSKAHLTERDGNQPPKSDQDKPKSEPVGDPPLHAPPIVLPPDPHGYPTPPMPPQSRFSLA
jgi:hypothetical protein